MQLILGILKDDFKSLKIPENTSRCTAVPDSKQLVVNYHYCTTSFIKVWTQVLRRFISCSCVSEIRDGEDLWQWSWLEIRLRLSSVNHTTKIIHHLLWLLWFGRLFELSRHKNYLLLQLSFFYSVNNNIDGRRHNWPDFLDLN